MEVTFIIILFLAIIIGTTNNLEEKFANYWYCPKDEPKKHVMYTNASSSKKKDNLRGLCKNKPQTKWGYNFYMY